MGCFDTVRVPCPRCNTIILFQSKGADRPSYREFDLDEAPADVLTDANRHAPYYCHHCGALVEVEVRVIATARRV